MKLTVGILAAMRAELEPFLTLGLGGETGEVLLGRPVYTRKAVYHGDQLQAEVDLVLMVSGVGKVRAASAVQALIDRHQPDLILNIGTAGGLRPEVRVGDIVITSKQYQHDCQLWERYCCESHSGLCELLHRELSNSHRVHLGNGCAGDTFKSSKTEKQRLAERFDAYCVDMESAALADTCAANQVPFCVIRSISDTLDGDEAEFELNYQRVSKQVAEAVVPLIGRLALHMLKDSPDRLANAERALRFINIETPRLLLRRLRSSDIAPLWRYRSDPEVAKYQGWDNYTEEQAHAMVQEQAGFDPGFVGTWFQVAISLRETNELIGDIGIHTLAPDGRQSGLGFTLARNHQGRGLATEAVGAIVSYLFAELKQHRIVAFVDPNNHASAALLRRLEFRQEGHQLKSTWAKGEWQDDLQFALLHEEWAKQTAQSVNTLPN